MTTVRLLGAAVGAIGEHIFVPSQAASLIVAAAVATVPLAFAYAIVRSTNALLRVGVDAAGYGSIYLHLRKGISLDMLSELLKKCLAREGLIVRGLLVQEVVENGTNSSIEWTQLSALPAAMCDDALFSESSPLRYGGEFERRLYTGIRAIASKQLSSARVFDLALHVKLAPGSDATTKPLLAKLFDIDPRCIISVLRMLNSDNDGTILRVRFDSLQAKVYVKCKVVTGVVVMDWLAPPLNSRVLLPNKAAESMASTIIDPLAEKYYEVPFATLVHATHIENAIGIFAGGSIGAYMVKTKTIAENYSSGIWMSIVPLWDKCSSEVKALFKNHPLFNDHRHERTSRYGPIEFRFNATELLAEYHCVETIQISYDKPEKNVAELSRIAVMTPIEDHSRANVDSWFEKRGDGQFVWKARPNNATWDHPEFLFNVSSISIDSANIGLVQHRYCVASLKSKVCIMPFTVLMSGDADAKRMLNDKMLLSLLHLGALYRNRQWKPELLVHAKTAIDFIEKHCAALRIYAPFDTSREFIATVEKLHVDEQIPGDCWGDMLNDALWSELDQFVRLFHAKSATAKLVDISSLLRDARDRFNKILVKNLLLTFPGPVAGTLAPASLEQPFSLLFFAGPPHRLALKKNKSPDWNPFESSSISLLNNFLSKASGRNNFLFSSNVLADALPHLSWYAVRKVMQRAIESNALRLAGAAWTAVILTILLPFAKRCASFSVDSQYVVACATRWLKFIDENMDLKEYKKLLFKNPTDDDFIYCDKTIDRLVHPSAHDSIKRGGKEWCRFFGFELPASENISDYLAQNSNNDDDGDETENDDDINYESTGSDDDVDNVGNVDEAMNRLTLDESVDESDGEIETVRKEMENMALRESFHSAGSTSQSASPAMLASSSQTKNSSQSFASPQSGDDFFSLRQRMVDRFNSEARDLVWQLYRRKYSSPTRKSFVKYFTTAYDSSPLDAFRTVAVYVWRRLLESPGDLDSVRRKIDFTEK
jgi:hypothetical protein